MLKDFLIIDKRILPDYFQKVVESRALLEQGTVKEVSEGYECGIGLEKFNDLKENDMFEVYTIEEYRD